MTSLNSGSPPSFWEGDVPDPELVEDPTPTDKTEQINPPANVCPGCGDPVERVPGSRGRVPKYHPECRPQRKSASITGAPRTVRVSKNEQLAAEQTEAIIAQADRGISKCVALLAVVEPYDALVIHINKAEFLDNLRPVLMQFEWLRRTAGGVSTGGSLAGLVITVLTTVLPIAAHHNLIPSKRVAQILLQIPMFLMKLQQRVTDADPAEVQDELLAMAMKKANSQREQMMRQRTAEENPDAASQAA